MATSMKDALKQAFSEKGIAMSHQPAGLPKKTGPAAAVRQPSSRNFTRAGQHIAASSQHVTDASEKPPETRKIAAIANKHSSSIRQQESRPVVSEYSIDPEEGACPACRIVALSVRQDYVAPPHDGIAGQVHAGEIRDTREVVIGLDFGTSSAKVVIGDLALDKAFAVPFGSTDGITKYLLPSRLYESAGCLSLLSGSQVHRDLKLSLLACPDDTEARIRVTAFLALVIRHARGWLLSTHKAEYKRTQILWKLVVGLPAAHHLDRTYLSVFERIAQAAWMTACCGRRDVTVVTVRQMLREADLALHSGTLQAVLEETEIRVVPEIAAQIYGFVASGRFDRHGVNRYMMVDVGAGTVDSALFDVRKGRGGRWDFEFFSSHVEQHGVMNLHRLRMEWWKAALTPAPAAAMLDWEELDALKFRTDSLVAIPDRLEDYFSGLQLTYRNQSSHPDRQFFMKNVVAQVRGRTMWRTWKENLLGKTDLGKIPAFLCGGGMRMPFYRQLEEELRNMPGCPWLSANARPLEVPRNLIAHGLPAKEYDRMSVAFGLSFLEIGKITKCPPTPKELLPVASGWRDRYIDKDQC